MATFRADITRNVEPAMANPALLGQAARAKAESINTLTGFAGELYKGYVASEMANIEEEAAGLGAEFLRTGKLAEEAAKQIPGVAAARGTVFGQFNEAAPLEQQEAVGKQLGAFDNELNRLKAAVEGGMSNERYISRIDSITKTAIAKFPGLANQIRERVAAVTGMPGADRWAQMSYVRDRFTPPKEPKGGKTEEELALDDIKRMAPLGTFGSSEELFKLFKENKPEYDRRRNAANEIFNVKTTTDTIKARVEGTTIQTDENVKVVQGSLGAIFQGSLTTAVLAQDVKEKENTFAKTIELMAAGDPRTVNARQFETLIQLHAAQMRSNVDNAKREATDTARRIIDANPGMSEARKKSLYEDIDKYAAEALTRYADKDGVGLVAMASILRNYRDKTVQERQQLLDLHIKLETATQNTPLVQQFRQGGEARKRLEREQPYFYQFMVKQENTIARLAQGLTGEIDGAANLADMRRVVLQAESSPDAVPVDPVSNPDNIRASHEALIAKSKQLLERGGLSGPEVNVASAALTTSIEYGANTRTLASDYRKLGDKILQLPRPDGAVISSAVSKSIQNAVGKVQTDKTTIEDKFKVKLTLGFNDAGQIVVLPPARPNIPSQRRAMTTAEMQAAAAPVINTAYTQATEEFNKKLRPILNNMVYGRAMLTTEEPKNVARDFAGIINNNQPYAGFFSMAGQEVSAPTAPAAPAAATPAAPAASAATPAASAPEPGVKATMADIAAYAASKKIKVSEAEKLLRAQGVIIED
jgi:hypothetical protein